MPETTELDNLINQAAGTKNTAVTAKRSKRGTAISHTSRDKRVLQKALDNVAEQGIIKELTHDDMLKAYDNFEASIGGRSTLLEILQHSNEDIYENKKIQQLLADKNIFVPGPNTLYKLCLRHKLSLATLVKIYRDAKMASLSAYAIGRLAEEAPDVVEQIAEDSLNRYDRCHVCSGTKRVRKMADNGEWLLDTEGKYLSQLCYNCRGTGKIFKEHNEKSRAQFLQITGILDTKRGPLVETNIDNRTAIVANNFTPGDGNFEKLIRAVDLVALKQSDPTQQLEEKNDAIDIPYTVYNEDSQ